MDRGRRSASGARARGGQTGASAPGQAGLEASEVGAQGDLARKNNITQGIAPPKILVKYINEALELTEKDIQRPKKKFQRLRRQGQFPEDFANALAKK
jgi:hypothetical protein